MLNSVHYTPSISQMHPVSNMINRFRTDNLKFPLFTKSDKAMWESTEIVPSTSILITIVYMRIWVCRDPFTQLQKKKARIWHELQFNPFDFRFRFFSFTIVCMMKFYIWNWKRLTNSFYDSNAICTLFFTGKKRHRRCSVAAQTYCLALVSSVCTGRTETIQTNHIWDQR